MAISNNYSRRIGEENDPKINRASAYIVKILSIQILVSRR
jgi:hypothetical protein